MCVDWWTHDREIGHHMYYKIGVHIMLIDIR